jgi:hypothetical protein
VCVSYEMLEPALVVRLRKMLITVIIATTIQIESTDE